MPNRDYSQKSSPPGPKFRDPEPKMGMQEKTWKHPACPGPQGKGPRPHGRRVKTAVAGNV